MLTAHGAYPSAANPFAPDNFEVPLLLVLHTESLRAQMGAARQQFEMLVSLGQSPYADVWLTAGEHTFGRGLAQAEAGAGTSEESLHGLPTPVDYDEAVSRFHAQAGAWSRWQQRADQRYSCSERESALDAYAGALLSVVANRHGFVTCNRQLLAERTEAAWVEANILDVREAIALVGLLMRQRGRCGLYIDWDDSFEPAPASHLHAQLASTLIDAQRGEFLDAVDAAGQRSDTTTDVMLSAEDRVSDLLVSRDEVHVASLLPHGGQMLASALYHFRAAVQTASALLDSLAVVACEQTNLQADPLTITFRRPDFRQALHDAGATSLAAVVKSQRFLSLGFCIAELRGPIGHGRGVRGVTDISARTTTSYLRINDAQAEKLKQAYGQRRESADDWGVHADDASLLEIDVFADKLARTVIEAFDETVTALIEDLRRLHPGPSRLVQAWWEGQDRLREIRARMPAPEREEIERREAEQREEEREDLRRTLWETALYAGLADWPLLERLSTARTA